MLSENAEEGASAKALRCECGGVFKDQPGCRRAVGTGGVEDEVREDGQGPQHLGLAATVRSSAFFPAWVKGGTIVGF